MKLLDAWRGRFTRSADDPERTCARDQPFQASLRHACQHWRIFTYFVRLRTIFHEHSKLLKVPSNSSWMNLPLMGCQPIVAPNVPSSAIVPRMSFASRSNVARPITTFPRTDSVTGAGLHGPVVAVAEPLHWPSYGPPASPVCGDSIQKMTEATMKRRRFIAALAAARPMCEVGAIGQVNEAHASRRRSALWTRIPRRSARAEGRQTQTYHHFRSSGGTWLLALKGPPAPVRRTCRGAAGALPCGGLQGRPRSWRQVWRSRS
jgi:hypothetical protein